MTVSPRTVDVGGGAPYRITIGPGLLDDGDLMAATLRGRHALIVSDANVAPLYADRLETALRRAKPSLQVARHVVAAGEAEKTLANFATVIDALASLGATRDACVVALGGGVVGDMAGFAAACWMRGIDCVQLPTTLLAMVDSSVGGKTAVDIPQGKNLVGAFHPPRAVIADTATLRTLPPRELRAGLAEVIKYGAIIDAPFLDWLDGNAAGLLAATMPCSPRRSRAAACTRPRSSNATRSNMANAHCSTSATPSAMRSRPNRAMPKASTTARRWRSAWCWRRGCRTRWAWRRASDADALQALLQRFGLPTAMPQGWMLMRCWRGCAWTRRPRPAGCASSCGIGRVRARVVADVDESGRAPRA
jgi:hypothetical protein